MKYVSDDLFKYECLECERHFIVSEYIAEQLDFQIYCPYCKSESVEAVAGCNDELLDELGCFGIYHYEESDIL